MDDARGVRRMKRIRNLTPERDDRRRVERSAVHLLLECHAVLLAAGRQLVELPPAACL
jgi:hypothetical protein